MRDLKELNINEGGRPVTRRPPTDGEIEAFESHFHLRLPSDYVSFLKQVNGGNPELDGFRPVGAEEDVLWSIDRFYHLCPDRDDIEGLWRVTEAWQLATGKQVVPFGRDGGGDQILFNYDSENPTVEVCIHDEEFRFVYAAKTFSEFLQLLVYDPDMI